MYRSPFSEKARQTTAFKKSGKWAAGYHTGEDWVCDSDKTLVAPTSGTITRNTYDGSGYGNYIVIATDDGKSILMGHMANKSNKSVGSEVLAGEIVGTMGNTGNSYGAHLHIEVQNSLTWSYNKNLLKPSNYIDFNNSNSTDKGEFEVAKVWKNGSTVESVFADSAFQKEIGTISAYEKCDCYGVVKGAYIVKYAIDGTNDYKVGFVKYHGGVK